MPKEAIEKYCDGESPYIGLIEPMRYFGCEVGTGSMGLGLPMAVGFALAKKINNEKGTIYVLMSDGEMQIGTTWESALLAFHHNLNNLVVIVDNNGLQAMGKTHDILQVDGAMYPLEGKFTEFGWYAKELNGHNFNDLEEIKPNKKFPSIFVCNTIKGKGVSFMENENEWHYRSPEKDEYEKAKIELNV